MSLFQRVPGITLTSPGLKVYRDPIANPGTLYGFDALDAYSGANLIALADGATVPDGTTLANLITGGAVGTMRLNTTGGAATLTKSAGGAKRGGLNAALDLGTGYGMQTSQHGFLVLCWMQPDAVTTPSADCAVIGYEGTTFANLQYILSFNPNTNLLRAQMGGYGTSGAGDKTLQQIGFAYYLVGAVPYIDLYRNGALLASANGGSIPTTIPTPEATGTEGFGWYGFNTTPKLNNQYNQGALSFLRGYKEDLALSSAASGLTQQQQARAQAAADWTANHARFGV